MAQYRVKTTGGAPDKGLLSQTDYVDPFGNLWIVGGVSISGISTGLSIPVIPAGTFPVVVSGPVDTNIAKIAGTAIIIGQSASRSSLPVVVAYDQSPIPVMTANASDATAGSSISGLNGSVILPLSGQAGVAYILSGTWTATLQAQLSVDGGVTWVAIDSYNYSSEQVALNVSANGSYAISDIRGASHIRVTATAFTSGVIQVTIRATTASALQNSKYDGVTGSAAPAHGVLVGGYDGTNLQALRTNLDNIAAVASASYTTTQTQADQTNHNARGIIAVLDMTIVGTGSVTLEIDGKDPVSGKYFALLTGAAVTTNSTNVYTVYPGNTATANVSASTVLPRTWRIRVTANNANAATYSVGVSLIV